MKTSDLRKLIREEVRKVISEANAPVVGQMATVKTSKGSVKVKILKKLHSPEFDIWWAEYPKGMLTVVSQGETPGDYVIDLEDIDVLLNSFASSNNLRSFISNTAKNFNLDGTNLIKALGDFGTSTSTNKTKSDNDKIELYVSNQLSDSSPRNQKEAIKYIKDEWKNVSKHYKSIEDYFKELDKYGGLESWM